MNLHRALQHEWSDVPVDERNRWQHVAARSQGVLTPANVVSVIGLFVTLVGLDYLLAGQTLIGILVVLLGRCADLVDGWVADKTGTKSPIGEGVDATIDKIEAFIILVVLLATSLVPLFVGLFLLLHHLLNTVVAAVAWRRGGRVHPTLSGKLGTALEWLIIAGFTLLNGLASHASWHHTAHLGLLTLFAITAALAVVAVYEYSRQYYALRKQTA